MEDITLNTLKNAKKHKAVPLSEGVVSDNYEASSEAAIILSEIHNCKKTDIVFNPDDMLSDEEKSQITKCQKEKERVPLQYIFGHAPFYGREFKVTLDNMVIPRFLMKVLVEMIGN